MLRTFAYFVLMLSIVSCQNANEEVLMNAVGDHWDKGATQSFVIDVNNPKDHKNIMVVVRNNNKYPYSNIRLFASIEHNKKNISIDTLNFVLAKPNGEWIGSGFGDTKETVFQYKLNYKFPQSGKYTVKFLQAMRQKNLLGIEDLGLKIQNVKP